MMKYPFRFPTSRLFAKLGFTISVSVQFFYDDDADVFIATSLDVQGLVLESSNFNNLKSEVKESIVNLLNIEHKAALPVDATDIIFTSHVTA